MSKSSIALSLFFLVSTAAGVASAAGPLSVASDEAAVVPPQDRERRGVHLGIQDFAFAGVAVDDYSQPGFIGHTQLSFFASTGLGKVSLLTGGGFGVEVTAFRDRRGMALPLYLTLGARSDTWLATASGGVSFLNDNSYYAYDDDEEAVPSPRGELRAGYRFRGFAELQGVFGVERQLWENREDVTRLYFGVAFGFGVDTR